MRYIQDRSGRFEQRPYYQQEELDQECERIIQEFLRDYQGMVEYPIETDALTVLVEQHAQCIDLFADLACEGEGIQGVTDFFPGERPQVRIDKRLSQENWRENRLRTTITHEFGHVRFHREIWEVEELRLDLFDESPTSSSRKCHRDSIMNAPQFDWMEWQAGYISGALLMPKSAVNSMVADKLQDASHYGQVQVETDLGQQLIRLTAETFQVSAAAARVRLLQLGAVTEDDVEETLF